MRVALARRQCTGVLALLCACAAAGLLTGSGAEPAWAAVPSQALGGQVYFYADLANSVPGIVYKNTPSVRPTNVAMVEDDRLQLEKLHWSSWGGPVARATGIKSALNCTPNCAQGKRKNDPVQFVLSQPKHLFGRSVYTCYKLTDLVAPQTDQNACLKHSSGNQYVYAAVARSPNPATSTPAGIRRVSFYSPSRNLSCVMLDGSRTSSFQNSVHCQSVDLPHAVGMGLDGQLKICHGLTGLPPCVYPHPGVSDIPKMVLAYGKQITVGRFRCSSASAGITCVVIKSGKGFLINSAGITRVGP